MVKRSALVVVSCLMFQPVLGMMKKEVVSYLEDTSKLLVSTEFKKLLDEKVGAPESYDFLCGHVIKTCPHDMEDRFGDLITKTAPGMSLVNFFTSRLGLNKCMVDGMVLHRTEVTNIFAQCSNCKSKVEEEFLTTNLAKELKESKDTKVLLYAIGRITTGKLLQCIHDNKVKIPHIIIKEMVEKKKDEKDGKDDSESGSHVFLGKIVTKILEKCTAESEEWKNFFGETTVTAYEQ